MLGPRRPSVWSVQAIPEDERYPVTVKPSTKCFKEERQEGNRMPKYTVGRDVAGAGQLSSTELHSIAKKVMRCASRNGAGYTWVESYITGNKTCCIYYCVLRQALNSLTSRPEQEASRARRLRKSKAFLTPRVLNLVDVSSTGPELHSSTLRRPLAPG